MLIFSVRPLLVDRTAVRQLERILSPRMHPEADMGRTVNNAGGGPLVAAMKATKQDLERTFGINVFASLYLMQATVPIMPRGGRIINIGSIASKMGMTPIPLYCASKAAMDALTFSMATEVSIGALSCACHFDRIAIALGRHLLIEWEQPGRGSGITVNTVAPGPIPTGRTSLS